MAAGIQETKSQADDLFGTTARAGKIFFERVAIISDYLASKTDADLTALGYSAGDIANIRSTFGDLAQLETIWRGTATLGTAKDFRTFARRLWGLGVIGTTT